MEVYSPQAGWENVWDHYLKEGGAPENRPVVFTAYVAGMVEASMSIRARGTDVFHQQLLQMLRTNMDNFRKPA